jgi:hypothetical protein
LTALHFPQTVMKEVVMSWNWEKPLSCFPGKLVVTPKGFHTSAYFRGPDLRYNGTSWKLDGAKIPDYIDALEIAWAKLETLQASEISGGAVRVSAPMNVYAVLRHPSGTGITLHRHHKLVSSREALDKLIAELGGLPKLAVGIQRALALQGGAGARLTLQ